MTRASWLVRLLLAAAVAVCLASATAARQQPAASDRWVTAWATSQNGLGMTTVTNTTVRMIARVTAAGDAVRIRLDNTFGATPLVVGNAYVGQRIQGAALAPGASRQASFNASSRVTVPPGGSVMSDPVRMNVLAHQDLAVTLYVPEAGVRPSQHSAAHVTSYLAADGAGDVSAEDRATPFSRTTTSFWWVKAVEVLSPASTGSIVVFGDSITDGTCTTLDAHDRWEDLLAVRLALDAASRGRPDAHRAVVNEGIGGNTVTRQGLQPAPDSTPGVERLERDVLSHHGVNDVVLFMGTNDLRREAPAAQVIAGLLDITRRVKARGLRAVGVTIVPRHNIPAFENNTGWNDAKTQRRHDVNRWIRSEAPFDAVIDFDQVVRDPTNGDRLYPPFNCGDGVHPSPRGYFEMGRSVGLDLFR